MSYRYAILFSWLALICSTPAARAALTVACATSAARLSFSRTQVSDAARAIGIEEPVSWVSCPSHERIVMSYGIMSATEFQSPVALGGAAGAVVAAPGDPDCADPWKM